jgi:hypothetical protein
MKKQPHKRMLVPVRLVQELITSLSVAVSIMPSDSVLLGKNFDLRKLKTELEDLEEMYRLNNAMRKAYIDGNYPVYNALREAKEAIADG